MLTENADCKREATGKIFPVYWNIFGVPRNIPDDTKKCHMSQHCKSSQTESACIATSKCIKATT